MNNFDRNTRTLIVSFLVAIFALIPLRFVEAGQEQSLMMDTQVLGESTVISDSVVEEDISVLEAPYDELERCMSKEDVKLMEEGVINLIQNDNLPKEELVMVLDELQKAEDNVCP